MVEAVGAGTGLLRSRAPQEQRLCFQSPGVSFRAPSCLTFGGLSPHSGCQHGGCIALALGGQGGAKKGRFQLKRVVLLFSRTRRTRISTETKAVMALGSDLSYGKPHPHFPRIKCSLYFLN